MIIEDKIIIKNYKCFDDEGGGFERIMPLNVIIGKNNSGKSTLIELVNFLVKLNIIVDSPLGRDKKNSPIAEITHELTEQEISRVFKSESNNGILPLYQSFEYGRKFKNTKFIYQLTYDGRKFVTIDASYEPITKELFTPLSNQLLSPFYPKILCIIPAERDIIQEDVGEHAILLSNGSGATNYIQHILNKERYDSNIIEAELLKELNKIVNPDIIFKRITVQEKNTSKWEIFFRDINDNLIELSKMGSGVKTILLVLLNLVVRPIMENKSKDHYVFAFEELENNLHPSLQRRLYNYIIEYSKKHSAYFFITTHSNIVIDIFGANEHAQIIHVENDGVRSKTTTVLSNESTKRILHDLGIKASDLLQCNGVIWVEGPSDRNYINKWLELLAPDLKEGLHYSIMFYGGRLLSNLSFDSESFNKEVIPLLKINRNAFVIIDRDGKIASPKLNDTKKRINQEIGDNHCWITEGREIENYLSDEVVTNWLLGRHGTNVQFVNDKNIKLEDNICNSTKKNILTYNSSKTLYSSEISEFIDPDSLNVMDLKARLQRLVEVIREWNRM